MSPLPSSFLETLTSYLEGQEAAGLKEIPWNGPRPSEAPRPAPPPPPPPAPEKAPPLEKRPVEAALPPTPKQEPVVSPRAPTVCWARATRHPDCPSPDGPEGATLLIVADGEEFRDKAGALMKDMLHAIGFELSDACTPATDPLPQDAARVLAMGNPGLQRVSKAGMELQIVRGLWQDTDAGRMIATYAPSAVEDSPSGKKTVWGDLQLLLEDLQLDIPEWTREKLRKK